MGCSLQYCIERVDRVIGPTSQSPRAPFGIWPLSFIWGISSPDIIHVDKCEESIVIHTVSTHAQFDQNRLAHPLKGRQFVKLVLRGVVGVSKAVLQRLHTEIGRAHV